MTMTLIEQLTAVTIAIAKDISNNRRKTSLRTTTYQWSIRAQ